MCICISSGLISFPPLYSIFFYSTAGDIEHSFSTVQKRHRYFIYLNFLWFYNVYKVQFMLLTISINIWSLPSLVSSSIDSFKVPL